MSKATIWFLSICFFVCCGVQWCAAQTQKYSDVRLRGYGQLSASQTSFTVTGGTASTLRIVCQNEDKAKLLQAKYLSDLQELPGVKPITMQSAGQTISGYAAQGQGELLAVRDGRTVSILASPSDQGLVQLFTHDFGTGTGERSLAFTAEVPVPMYLDRFDKYGLKSYYSVGNATATSDPPGTQRAYDPIRDLNYAAQIGHTGFVIWENPNPSETAKGIPSDNGWDWMVRAANFYGLPVGINPEVYNTSAIKNRYPEQLTQYQPQFLGGWYGSMNFNEEIVSWDGFQAKDVALGDIQRSIRALAKQPNITEWLEPHEEMGHGIADLMLEYGPVADQGYRTYLQSKYGSAAAVSQRWFGSENALKGWPDVHVPELYSFLGWGSEALDLTGLWHISYDAPFEAVSAAPSLDDSSWPTVPAPGHAIVMQLPSKAAVFRRQLEVPAAWLSAHPHVWLYDWDLNNSQGTSADPRARVQIYVNGQLIPENPPRVTDSHFVALDVTSALVAGNNLITIMLPNGKFNGRVYLSPTEPRSYPDLGPSLNAQWADFSDWNRWVRGVAVNRGAQMIRQIDPDRGIKFMAPAYYSNEMKAVAKAYGGDFHDTGSMAGFWNEVNCADMRSANLPTSCEPGGPALTVPDFQAYFGRWLTEGVNAIDYFQFLGDIEYNPAVRKSLDDNLTIYKSVGKYHVPTAQIAALYSDRNDYLTYFPWTDTYYPGSNPAFLGSGYWNWNIRAVLRNFYESDGLSESSFASGDAARYKVVIDTNTSIMDDALVSDIEKYVRAGGTFVTYVQTGRHTSALKDAWPIERLTGYHVTSLEQPHPWQTNMLTWAPGQSILSGDFLSQSKAGGLSMRKSAPGTIDLAHWASDGSVAIGMRPLGKGAIIEVGCRFTKGALPDRIDYDIWKYYKGRGSLDLYGLPPTTDAGLMTPELQATHELFSQILQWRGVPQVPMHLEPGNAHIMARHNVSNNGLYDVWTLWNDSYTIPALGKLVFSGDVNPAWQINLKDGTQTPVTNRALDFSLAPLQTVITLTPRSSVAAAPAEWFNLQRGWWQGTADPGKPFPQDRENLTVDLTQDWAFLPLNPQADAAPLAAPAFPDATWKRRELGVFTVPDYPQARHGVFRKRFTVPAQWKNGRVLLSMNAWNGSIFLDSGHVFLDGALIPNPHNDALWEREFADVLRPGTTHVLAVEVSGQTNLVGVGGEAWISYHPDPASRMDLAGNWDISKDHLRYALGTLPGEFAGVSARKTVHIDSSQSARTVVVHALGDGRNLHGVIINGRFVQRFHHWLGWEQNLNITPWVKFGADNELILLGNGGGSVKEVSLEFHNKGTYP